MAVLSVLLPYHGARADDTSATQVRSTLEAFFSAFTLLDRHEIAGLALTRISAAVSPRSCWCAHATASPRWRHRRATSIIQGRVRSAAMRCCSQAANPRCLDGGRRGGNHGRSHAGDGSRRAPSRARAGTWLEPGAASEMERSVDALRARGVSFAMTLTALRRANPGGRGPDHRRTGHPAAAASQVSARVAELVQRHQSRSTTRMRADRLYRRSRRAYRCKPVFVNRAYARWSR